MKYSVVIPVFNSEHILAGTVDKVVSCLSGQGLDFELLLVNDGSADASWDVICRKAREYPMVRGFNLLRNYGQHTANFCGFSKATGDYVITMDDDLQNPPEEIPKLIEKAAEGHDLVIGRFIEKKHSFHRRIGTRIIGWINRRIFHNQKGLVLTNFRLIRRDVIDRVLSYKTSYPYIPGLVLLFSNHRANTIVRHDEGLRGKSNYTVWRILRLVATILFNYSSLPLRLVAGFGLAVSAISFLLGGLFLLRQLVFDVSVPGWTSIVVLLSLFNGITLLILGMLGEYLVRLVNQVSSSEPFHVKESVN